MLKVCTVFVKRAYSTIPPRLLCDFHRAATKGWPQNESCAILFSAPGISVSDPETIPNLWKQKPALPGRSFPVTKVEFIRVITKQKSAIFPPPEKSLYFKLLQLKNVFVVS